MRGRNLPAREFGGVPSYSPQLSLLAKETIKSYLLGAWRKTPSKTTESYLSEALSLSFHIAGYGIYRIGEKRRFKKEILGTVTIF